ncbi:MAG: hypothetical protein A2513_11170 [Sulfurimonas sp. RIFOXYD12_FULL_33_39]|uniref:hypothetical protein n=1 Tax=unclassified Sulfurimonas TaxID=2623549 RepID=UPI0008B35768|nr:MULTISPECIES: hypothetical protein [unclassified Sulfurimonas]OHE05384.1 MAG: hypothetical protein A3G74_07985 [Sulfurimonas sp. RIFCSPLOWO2_12_FULL_34_6]OHE09858.1 MAG: hypothetical protein A2513_11170 [Sulfurimonas sp. RIFOXYD12_FULL_33_39]OHE13634.1 MAG: hypothetical protein A2530_08585 [Sulfurimonas sp. RIFOXYD2_FULL_34_21]DAB27363.1 MAG TPA: hypothetical protein CFH78_08260 [Sulfurimonas sp. UBA10385]
MPLPYFKNIQSDILAYKEKLDKNNVTIDKTNLMFLNLILDILEYLGTEDANNLDEQCEYNIMTMRKEFEGVIHSDAVNEKAQAILLTFFLRVAKEMEVKYKKIDNEYLQTLYSLMTSKDFKYPSYIKSQKTFALDKMPENIRRMEYLK